VVRPSTDSDTGSVPQRPAFRKGSEHGGLSIRLRRAEFAEVSGFGIRVFAFDTAQPGNGSTLFGEEERVRGDRTVATT
jgi:hypothetical protein